MNGAPEDRLRGRGDLLAVLFLLLLVLLFFGDVLFGDRALVTCNMSRWLPWRASASVADLRRAGFRDDAAETYFPRRFLSGSELREGRIPLWNPYILCGTPHLADFQSAVFHPLNLALYGTDPLWAMGAYVAVHLFLGAWFLFLLLRSFRVGVAGSLVGALSFLFNAYFATYLGHPPHIATGCWLPLLFLLVKRHMDGAGGIGLPAAVAIATLGGFPQTLLYGLLASGAYALFLWGGAPRGERRGGALRLAALCGLLAIGVGLVLFQVAPTAELARLTARREIALPAILSEHQAGPLSLVRMFLPDFFGNPISETYWLGALYGPFTHPSDLGFIGYAGVLPLLFAATALFLSRRRETLFFALLAAAALALAFSAPVFSLFYRALPLARFSTGLHRLQFPFLFAVAVLAGFGYDELRARASLARGRPLARTIAAWLLLLPIAAAFVQWEGPRILARASERLERIERAGGAAAASGAGIPALARGYLAGDSDAWRRSAWRGYARFAALVGIGAAALLLHRTRRVPPAAGAVLVLAAVAADGWTFARLYYTPQPKTALYAPNSLLDQLHSDQEPFRVARLTSEYLLPSNTGIPYGIEDLQGVNALMSADYGALFQSVHPSLYPDGRRITPFRSGTEIALPLWDLLGTRYFLLSPARPGQAPGPEALLEGVSGVRIVEREPFTVVENLEALPRAFLRHAYRVERNRARILREMVSPELDPAGPLWLEEEPGIPSLDRAVLPEDACVLAPREGSSVTVRTRSAEPGLLFLGETHLPGWEARVDGERRPILRADYAFRAVAVPAGEHSVDFRYRPASFRIGLAGSALSLLVYAGVLFSRRRPARDLSG